jgi:hypothetical protein
LSYHSAGTARVKFASLAGFYLHDRYTFNMKKFLTEPLVHFLILGVLIFAVFSWFNRDQRSEDEIFVSRSQQEHLVNMFSRTWQRPPTPQEYQGLLRDYIREEIAYRESVAMGLDQGDTIIRRRMRQKLELLTDEIVSFAEPGDEDLQSYLDENPEVFRIEPRFDLRQIYISLDKRGAGASAFALALLDQLRSEPEGDWRELGDSLPLPAQAEDIRLGELSRQFGSQFADSLLTLEHGEWVGPVHSGYGLHLVVIDGFTPARNPGLGEVRDRVKNEWLELRRRNATDVLYDRLAEKYEIEIESLVEENAP